MDKRILIGISGGIAAVKIPILATQLKESGYDVKTVLTQSATHIISSETLKEITGHDVYTQMYPSTFNPTDVLQHREVEHIKLADSTDVFVIAPATANVIAKLANGIADDYLTTIALAVTCPVLVCPSMNPHMWQHPATQRNIAILRKLGYHILPPDEGSLACGYEGIGRMPEPSSIKEAIDRLLNDSRSLKGKRVVVTTGGTTEPIDDVRTISNRSSGKMGAAIADACVEAGAEVVLLKSTTGVSPRYSMTEHTFETSTELDTLLTEHLPSADICIHAAAVSDFSVKNQLKGKHSSSQGITLELEPKKKLLDAIKTINPSIFLVAFKAESAVSNEELVETAQKRLKESGADLIVANDISRAGIGFQSDENEVFIVKPDGTSTHIEKSPKREIATKLISFLSTKE